MLSEKFNQNRHRIFRISNLKFAFENITQGGYQNLVDQILKIQKIIAKFKANF